MKRFHVRMWDDFIDLLPSEDEWVDAHTHMQALEIACHHLLVHQMDWVQVDEQEGQTMKFLDVSVTLGGSVEYEVFSS